jgi:hypothetical protein
MVNERVQLKKDIFYRKREKGQGMVVPHIGSVENSFNVLPRQFHNEGVFCDIGVIIPIDKFVLKRWEVGRESNS